MLSSFSLPYPRVAELAALLTLASRLLQCDGNKPCTRCKNLGVPECVYEVPVRQSKEALREEIEVLNRQKRTRDQLLGLLARPDRPDLREDLLSRLSRGESIEKITEWLAASSVPPTNARKTNATSQSSSSGHRSLNRYTSGSVGGHATSKTHSMTVPLQHQDGQWPAAGSHMPWGPAHASSDGLDTSVMTSAHHDAMDRITNSAGGQTVGAWLDNAGEWHSFHGLEQVLSPELPEMKVTAEAWTNVTDDTRLIQHLLALYFCWEYPTFASLSKEQFLRDFQDGRTRYCSSILVNALLALGCRFSKHPGTRAKADDPYTCGDHFFSESLRLYREEEDHCRMTTVQALGIMAIREASCGRDSESWYYAGQSIRLALEMGLQKTENSGGDDDDNAVRSATLWGAYSLDLAWCLATGSLPQLSHTAHLPPKPAIINDIEASLWVPYTDNGTPLQRSCEQPSNVRSVYKCFCELSELVHRSLYILHTPGRTVNARALQKVYTEYLSWYEKIPDVLRLGHNFTPAVLFAQ